MDQLDALRQVVQRLEAAGIPYMLTGAAAGVYYGIPRYTRDLDLVIEIDESDVERIDIQGIMRGNPDLDRAYLEHWARELALDWELRSLWP